MREKNYLSHDLVKRFPWSSYSTRTSEFLKEVGKKNEAKSGNLSLRCIVELLGAKQTRDLESMEVMVLWFSRMMVTS